ncbi:MAG: hypothetical protein KW806_01300 [Candidatus Yanofskybacteria bacterium]|nr:hypothetical protein [Candidatus Yanofskybacteria bacterium]
MVYGRGGLKKNDGSVRRDGCGIKVGQGPAPEELPLQLPRMRLKDVRKMIEKKRPKKDEPKVVGKCGLVRMDGGMTKICDGDIVEHFTQEFDPTHGPMRIGGSNPTREYREVFCSKCGVRYQPSLFPCS